MNALGDVRWIRTVLILGVGYLVIGLVTARLAAAATGQLKIALRLSAWAISAAALATHVVYDHVRLHGSPRSAALHAASAVGLGAFGLAVAASVHALSVRQHFPTVALAVWPVATALPAFVVALVLASVVARARRE